MPEILVSGAVQPAELPAPDLGAFGADVKVRVTDAVRLGTTRGGPRKELRVADDDVVEVELQDGIRLWMPGGSLPTDTSNEGTRGPTLSDSLRLHSPTRGVGTWALKALRVLDVHLADDVATDIVQKLESRLAHPGLYRCISPTILGTAVSSPSELPTDNPLLVFLHGTGSSTAGSFGGLAGGVWPHLVERYGENIFALEHHTLSRSPIENALVLAKLLPKRARLHLVSHSRGGLIGELLAHSRQEEDKEAFPQSLRDRFNSAPRSAERAEDIVALEALNNCLGECRPCIERFVRVACPARGTTLASGRLDLYLSILVNLVGLAGLRGTPVYEFLTALTLAVVKKRTDPTVLPGLEAMMPTSPLIALLNDEETKVDADLSVIAGDTEGAGILGRLRTFATDVFYLENHDLVVNTGSMVGGAPRSKPAHYYFDKGSEVSHFHYFINGDTQTKALQALTRDDNKTPEGFAPIEEETAHDLKTRAPGLTRPRVFILPDSMGSQLADDDGVVWINALKLSRGRFIELPPEQGVERKDLLGRPYNRLVNFLQASHDVIPFAYDWRRSITAAADDLAGEVARQLSASTQPIRFLAHGTGGLVVRTMIALHEDVWRQLTARDGTRLVMLGTPNRGSWAVPRLLLGEDSLVPNLALLDPAHSRATLCKKFASFPGLLELLPWNEQGALLAEPEWRKLQQAHDSDSATPSGDALEQASQVQKLLDAKTIDPDRMMYVAGRAPATPAGYRFDVVDTEERVRFLATAQGDGRVAWDAGILPGVTTWYMEARHGDMADHRPAFAALQKLLEEGTTSLLPKSPPGGLRKAGDLFDLPSERALLFPDTRDITASALGANLNARQTETAVPLEVTVVHGNLAFSPDAVAVGHYEGDVLIAGERVLNTLLEDALSLRKSLGPSHYAGPLGTSTIILRDDVRPRGAVVVGLGRVGTLTAARLQRTFKEAVVEYALRIAEHLPADPDAPPLIAGIATVLIGSGAGGISIASSVSAILAGTLEARVALDRLKLSARVRVDRLEFCEIYEDASVQAARAVSEQITESRVRDKVTFSGRIIARTGRRRRVSFEESREWWDRMLITEDAKGTLCFRVLTDRARAEGRLVPTQKAALDNFVRNATGGITDDAAVARTLFEMLLPNDMKGYAPDRNRLVLIVDRTAAAYPWELLRNDSSDMAEPLAVKQPLLRQLQTDDGDANPAQATGDGVLVIGNPLTDDELPSLEGAEREAEAVAKQLEQAGMSVATPLIRSGNEKIITALSAQQYRIMHIAAHGVYEYTPRKKTNEAAQKSQRTNGTGKKTGIMLDGGVYLRSEEFHTLITAVPELVFLNCCYTAKGAGDLTEPQKGHYPHLAANVAAQLIRMGVRAVVAAGWLVEDSAAVTFASTFYDAMLAKKCFGDAVHLARRETYAQHPGYNTWGAYQCYGDPDYVLKRNTDYAPPPATDFSCPAELLAALENLAQDADTASQVGTEELGRRLQRIKEDIPGSWVDRADVIAALARAFGQLKLFDEAIAEYEKLLKAESADYPVAALEQLSNLRVRASLTRWDALPDEAAKAEGLARLEEEIRAAITELEDLPAVRLPAPAGKAKEKQMSSERRSLIGSAYKRLSQILKGTKRRDALRLMANAYKLAAETNKTTKNADTYPLLNWLTAEVVLKRLKARGTIPDLKQQLEEAAKATAQAERNDPNFWTATAAADVVLIQHLLEGTLGDRVTGIVREYRHAWSRGGSPRQLASALEQFKWLITVLQEPDAAGAAPMNPTTRALDAIRREIAAFAGLETAAPASS